MIHSKTKFFDILLILSVSSSAAMDMNTKVKRTRNTVTELNEQSQRNDARLALLWGEQDLEEDSHWYENMQRLLGGSGSYSHSKDEDDDDDDDGDNHDMGFYGKDLNVLPNEVALITNPILIENITNATNVTETEEPTAAPVTPPPTSSPTAAPTTASPTFITASPTETKATEASEPKTGTVPKEDKLEAIMAGKVRKCGVETPFHQVNAELVVKFSYAVETTTKSMDFLGPLESKMLDSISREVLECSHKDGGRIRALRRKLNVVEIDASTSGRVSSYNCQIENKNADYCTVIDGTITLGMTDNKDEVAVRETVLDTIEEDMKIGAYISSDIPELVGTRYLGPDPTPAKPEPEMSDANLRSSAGATSGSSEAKTGFISAAIVCVAILVIILVVACIRRQRMLKAAEDELSAVAEKAEKNGVGADTESDTSEKNKEEANSNTAEEI